MKSEIESKVKEVERHCGKPLMIWPIDYIMDRICGSENKGDKQAAAEWEAVHKIFRGRIYNGKESAKWTDNGCVKTGIL